MDRQLLGKEGWPGFSHLVRSYGASLMIWPPQGGGGGGPITLLRRKIRKGTKTAFVNQRERREDVLLDFEFCLSLSILWARATALLNIHGSLVSRRICAVCLEMKVFSPFYLSPDCRRSRCDFARERERD